VGFFEAVSRNPNETSGFAINSRNLNDLVSSNLPRRFVRLPAFADSSISMALDAIAKRCLPSDSDASLEPRSRPGCVSYTACLGQFVGGRFQRMALLYGQELSAGAAASLRRVSREPHVVLCEDRKNERL
jgi:hypothetical protein